MSDQEWHAIRYKAERLWSAARLRAGKRKLPFTITKEWVIEAMASGRCQVTGLSFSPGKGLRGNFSASLDRAEPVLGYTEANCRLVVWIYNCAKGAGSDEDVIRMAEALVRKTVSQ